MRKSIFDYLDYRQYLNDLIKSRPGQGRGERAKLAEVLSCQRSFVSQVLQKEMHFSLEQAERLNRYFQHGSEECDFMMLLIQFNRAGTKELAEYFRIKIKKSLNDRLIYDKRLQSEMTMSFEDQVHYYSAWYYSVIGVALGIPELRTPETLAQRLALPIATVKEVLSFLEKCGLVEKRLGIYVNRPHLLHLGDNSALMQRFHTNWRVRVISALQHEGPKDLHYSCSMSLSKDDLYKVQSLMVKYIEELQKQIAPSADETLAALCIDFFEL